MIDVVNKFMVGSRADKIFIMAPPIGQEISCDEALLLAAYLVSLAEPRASNRFEEVLTKVQNT